MEPGRHDDHVAFNFLLPPGAAFRHALRATVEPDAVLSEADNIAAQPLGMAFADLAKEIRIHHRRPREQPLFRRRQIFKVAIEEETKQALGDPREDGFFAKDVERQEDVDEGVAGNDPFV